MTFGGIAADRTPVYRRRVPFVQLKQRRARTFGWRYSVTQVARVFGVHVNTVRGWILDGHLRARHSTVDGRWLIRRTAVRRLLAQHERAALAAGAVANQAQATEPKPKPEG